MKISKFYSYKELPPEDGKILFGWNLLDSGDTLADKEVIVSYASKSKKVSPEDSSWSKEEGSSASSVEDYEKYFAALTGLSSADFISKWTDRLEDLERDRLLANKNYRKEEGAFLLSLAHILSGEKDKFSKFGRIFKRVNGSALFKQDKEKRD